MLRLDDCGVAQRRDNLRAIPLPEAREGLQIEVIIMVVRDHHRVDPGQRIERDARGVVPLRPGEPKGTRAPRPDGVGQDIQSADLDEKRRMADERHAQRLRIHRRRRLVAVGARIFIRPRRPRLGQLPAQEIAEAARACLASGIEEAPPVEMVTRRAVVVEAPATRRCRPDGAAEERETCEETEKTPAGHHAASHLVWLCMDGLT